MFDLSAQHHRCGMQKLKFWFIRPPHNIGFSLWIEFRYTGGVENCYSTTPGPRSTSVALFFPRWLYINSTSHNNSAPASQLLCISLVYPANVTNGRRDLNHADLGGMVEAYVFMWNGKPWSNSNFSFCTFSSFFSKHGEEFRPYILTAVLSPRLDHFIGLQMSHVYV